MAGVRYTDVDELWTGVEPRLYIQFSAVRHRVGGIINQVQKRLLEVDGIPAHQRYGLEIHPNFDLLRHEFGSHEPYHVAKSVVQISKHEVGRSAARRAQHFIDDLYRPLNLFPDDV